MNESKKRASIGMNFTSPLVLFFCLIVSEVPVFLCIKATIAIVIQAYAGAAIYKQFTHPRRPTDLEITVTGLAIGVALSTLCDIALRTTIGFQFGWLFPALVIVISSIARGSKSTVATAQVNSSHKASTLLPIATIAFLYLGQDSVWPLWVFAGGVVIWIAVSFPKHLRSAAIRWILVVVGAISISTSFFNRPPFWWYTTDDFRVFEALSISVTKFGPNNAMGALGTLGAEYHFMTYAFSGMTDAIIGAPTFLVLNHLMPMLTALLLSATIWMFIERDGGNRRVPNFILASLFPIFFDYSFTSPSYCFGLFFYLIAIFFWTDNRNATKLIWRIPLNFVFAIFVITTKVSNLPTVLSGLACIAGYGVLRRQAWAKISLVNFLVTTNTCFVYFVLFLANSRTSSQISSSYVFGFAQNLVGDISTVDDRPTRILVGLLITSIFLVLPILGSILFLAYKWASATMLCLIVLPSIPLVIISALFGGHAASGYFVLSSLNLLNIALIIGVSHYVDRFSVLDFARTRFALLFIAIVISTYVIRALQIRSNGGGQNPILIRALLSAHWIPSVFIAVLFILFRKKVRPNIRHMFLFAVIVAELTFFATISFQTKGVLTKGPELTGAESAVAIGTPDQIDVGIWIREHLPESAVLASNYFCENACRGANWFEEDFKLLDETYNFPPSPNGYGSFDMILPLYAERRFLIQGSRFLLVNGMDRNEIRSRMSATLQFANKPSPNSLATISDAGVQYFVIDRKATDQESWEAFAKELYRNSTFIVLELNSL
jgi:hypothetical protein